MHVPCPGCGALTQFEGAVVDQSSTLVDCPGCGGRFRVALQAPETKGDPQSYLRARDYAREHGIDVPTAYSVLEGLITLDEARGGLGAGRGAEAESVAGGGIAVAPPPPTRARTKNVRESMPEETGRNARERNGSAAAGERASKRSSRVLDDPDSDDAAFDPAFAGAVKDGCLTPQQARDRGDRRALALRLSTRHRLPMDLATMAADNRLTIHQAMMQKLAREGKTPAGEGSSLLGGLSGLSGPWRAIAYLFVGAALVGSGIKINAIWQGSAIAVTPPPSEIATQKVSREGPTPAVPVAPPALTVPKVDAAGQLVQIVGPDPRSVLASFCGSGIQAGHREPVEIADTIPPSAGWRLGLFRPAGQPDGTMRAIRIRRDIRTARWVAGDGRNPIPTETVSLEPPARPRQPAPDAGGSDIEALEAAGKV